MMEIEQFIQKKKEIYSFIMKCFDSEIDEIDDLNKNIEKQEILSNKAEMIIALRILCKISENHCRITNFIDKIGKMVKYLINKIQSQISDYEIYQIFKKNKRILLLLFEEKLIQPGIQIISDIMLANDDNNFPYRYYLYPGIKTYIEENKLKAIENDIQTKFCEEINDFEEKCRIGENDSYICSLIRQDSIEEFIAYVNRTNTPLSSQINPSIFETNSFLIQKNPTLIEYACFFGSIQVIRYLKYNRVPLTYS